VADAVISVSVCVGDWTDTVGRRGNHRAGVSRRSLLYQGVRRSIPGPRRFARSTTCRRYHVHCRNEVCNILSSSSYTTVI